MHNPQRWNVTSSVVGLRKKNGHICKNLIKNGEPQRYVWGTQKKKDMFKGVGVVCVFVKDVYLCVVVEEKVRRGDGGGGGEGGENAPV